MHTLNLILGSFYLLLLIIHDTVLASDCLYLVATVDIQQTLTGQVNKIVALKLKIYSKHNVSILETYCLLLFFSLLLSVVFGLLSCKKTNT